MAAHGVVPTYDSGEDGHACLSLGIGAVPRDLFDLQAGEEAIGQVRSAITAFVMMRWEP